MGVDNVLTYFYKENDAEYNTATYVVGDNGAYDDASTYDKGYDKSTDVVDEEG